MLTDKPSGDFHWFSERGLQPPFLGWLVRLSHRQVLFVGFGFFVISGIVCAGLAQIHGDLIPRDGWAVFRNDLKVMFLFRSSTAADPRFPFLRDLPTIAQLAMIAALFPLTYRTLRSTDLLLTDMGKSGALRYDSAASKLVEEHVVRTARSLRHVEWNVAITFASIGAPVAAAVGYRRAGVFQRYHCKGAIAACRSTSIGWSHRAFAGWWARAYGPGFGAWLVIAIIGTYLIMQYVRLVTVTTLFFVRNHSSFVVSVDPLNLDGAYGWAAARTLLISCMWSMGWFSLGVLAFTYLTGASAVVYLLPFVALLANGIVLLLWPLTLYSRVARAEKARLRTELLGTAPPPEELGATEAARLAALRARALYRDEARAVAAIPDRLVGNGRLVWQILVVVLPALVAIVTVLRTVLG